MKSEDSSHHAVHPSGEITQRELRRLHLPSRASQVIHMVKNTPAIQETWDQFLDWEDPLKKGMATLSSILAWRIPWTEEAGRLQSLGSQRVRHD